MTVQASWTGFTPTEQPDDGDDPFAVDVTADGQRIDLDVRVPAKRWLAGLDLGAPDAKLYWWVYQLAETGYKQHTEGLTCEIRWEQMTDDGRLPCIACPLGDQNISQGSRLHPHCRNGRRLEAALAELARRRSGRDPVQPPDVVQLPIA